MKPTAMRLLALGLVGIAACPAAVAQTPSAPAPVDSPDDEIIVTAQKRSQRLQDVPISITALSGDQLVASGIVSPDDLQKIVPGFTFKTTPLGAPVYSIRGIGFDDISVDASPAVSVSLDQVPIPFLSMAQGLSLDLERVEVLKGPQGTLFGQNSTGGAINYIAAKPTSEFSAGFDLTYGRFNELRANMFVSGPVSDALRVRLAVRHDRRDGWQISETRPDDRLGSRDFSVGRFLVDWTPSDRATIALTANGWIDRSETQASQFQFFQYATPPQAGGSTDTALAVGSRGPARSNPRVADWDPGRDFRRDDYLYQLAARADFKATDEVTLSSITSYARYRTEALYDPDAIAYGSFDADQRGNIKTFYQELRLTALFGGASIIVGANYEYDKTFQSRTTRNNASNSRIAGIETSGFQTPMAQEVGTYALFASGELPLSATLTAQAGIRYTKQNRDYAGCLADFGDGTLSLAIARIALLRGGRTVPPPASGACVTLDATFTPVTIIRDELNEDNISWKAGLDWKPGPDTLVYANVTRGYKAGGFSPQASVFIAQQVPVTQEKVTTYEIGGKASVLDRKFQLTGALFYNDYADKQLLGFRVVDPFGSLIQLLNVPRSVSKGAEIALNANPLEGLTISGGLTYVHSRVTESFVTSSPVLPIQVDIKGESFPNAPRWQGNLNAGYEFPLSATLTASLGADFSYRSASSAQFGDHPAFRYEDYGLVGMRAGFGATDLSWRIEVFGRNIANKYYWVNVFKAGDIVTRVAGMPATYGISLRARL